MAALLGGSYGLSAEMDMTVFAPESDKHVSAVIAQSWHRCSKYMQRDNWQAPHQAQGLTYASICRRKTALLTIGRGHA
ncbi:hypothetical protein WDV93_23515 [Pantoea ananatis]